MSSPLTKEISDGGSTRKSKSNNWSLQQFNLVSTKRSLTLLRTMSTIIDKERKKRGIGRGGGREWMDGESAADREQDGGERSSMSGHVRA